MTGKPVIDKFLHAIETANIPGCDAWSADASLTRGCPTGGCTRTVRDDRIVSDMVFCGGRWLAALLAEMEAAGA